jgi:hypothetical protein
MATDNRRNRFAAPTTYPPCLRLEIPADGACRRSQLVMEAYAYVLARFASACTSAPCSGCPFAVCRAISRKIARRPLMQHALWKLTTEGVTGTGNRKKIADRRAAGAGAPKRVRLLGRGLIRTTKRVSHKAQSPNEARSPRSARGTKKKTTDPDVYLINFRGTNQPHMFFFVRFWAFLGKGSPKTP